jgi:hypothetical protein
VRVSAAASGSPFGTTGGAFVPEESSAPGAPGGPGERVGLTGMRERVALLGGDFRVASRPGAGPPSWPRFPCSRDLPEEAPGTSSAGPPTCPRAIRAEGADERRGRGRDTAPNRRRPRARPERAPQHAGEGAWYRARGRGPERPRGRRALPLLAPRPRPNGRSHAGDGWPGGYPRHKARAPRDREYLW